MGWSFRSGLRARSNLRLSYENRRSSGADVLAWSRYVLWLAVLLYGAHLGASVYEMLVVTPHWAIDPPQSVRDWSFIAEAEIRPMAYKGPAILALGLISMAMLWLSLAGRTTARAWMALAGILGVIFVAATMLFAFPMLERIQSGGEGLTDRQILDTVGAWRSWCSVRLIMLLSIWTASLVALIRTSSRQMSDSLR